MNLVQLIEAGSSNFLILISTALVLGALHGLEPGHSKTMMAAFIIAIRGTVTQATLLGISATISHTALVWIVALSGMYFFGGKFDAQNTEPYFQLVSGILIIVAALWMLIRTWRHQQDFNNLHHHHHHDHDHHHDHHHEKELKVLNVVSPEYHDAHELQHAQDINRRFSNKNITTGQIIIFGLTGGLIPCPASITVLLLCLQLKKIALGSVLVLGFSVGLAATMVVTGIVASLSVTHFTKRWKGFSAVARRAPYFSGALISLVGIYVVYRGIITL
jgi:ABC-type nickel/cobalt efflux system permease component RcnA